MHNFSQMKVKATDLAADKTIGFAAGYHHGCDSGLIIAHNLACGVHRDTVTTDALVIERCVLFMSIIIAGIKYFHIGI